MTLVMCNSKMLYFKMTSDCASVMCVWCRQDRDIEPEDFQRYSENVQVSLQDCPLERPPAALNNKESRESSRRSPGHSRKVQHISTHRCKCTLCNYTVIHLNILLYFLRWAGMSLAWHMARRTILWMFQRRKLLPVTCPLAHEWPATPTTMAVLPTADMSTHASPVLSEMSEYWWYKEGWMKWNTQN